VHDLELKISKIELSFQERLLKLEEEVKVERDARMRIENKIHHNLIEK